MDIPKKPIRRGLREYIVKSLGSVETWEGIAGYEALSTGILIYNVDGI